MIRSWIAAAARRRLELVVGGVGPGVEQVVADRGVEQVGLLGDHADDLAERREGDPPDVVAVDLDGAGIDVVEARDR